MCASYRHQMSGIGVFPTEIKINHDVTRPTTSKMSILTHRKITSRPCSWSLALWGYLCPQVAGTFSMSCAYCDIEVSFMESHGHMKYQRVDLRVAVIMNMIWPRS